MVDASSHLEFLDADAVCVYVHLKFKVITYRKRHGVSLIHVQSEELIGGSELRREWAEIKLGFRAEDGECRYFLRSTTQLTSNESSGLNHNQ